MVIVEIIRAEFKKAKIFLSTALFYMRGHTVWILKKDAAPIKEYIPETGKWRYGCCEKDLLALTFMAAVRENLKNN
jgi:hypothetical protein